MTEETLFAAALEKQDPAERAAFLEEACADDAGLRTRVEALLQAHAEAGNFLEPLAAGAVGTDAHTPHPATKSPFEEASTIGYQPPREGVGTLLGPYKLLQQLGEGGMGTVFLAEQREPVARKVALKIIKTGVYSAHVLARFEAERQALALMDHPNIAKVLDAGTTESGQPYFVMELVKGVPITKYCDQEQLTPKQRLELFLPVCQAVQHAHQKGIIHRDLKPSNVLIALYDGVPVPKVIDFGVAKATSQKLTERTLFTEVGQVVGTVEYMSPEQAELNNLDIDTRADIYSLGVLLYELLTGSPPFTAQQLRSAAFTEMLRIIREVEPPKPSTKLSSSEELPRIAARRKLEPKRLTKLVRGELDWIVMKCLEKERGRRYETANGLARDLQHYLADEPVLAGPPGVGYRLRKFLRRHKGPVLAVSLLLLALVGGIVSTSVGLVKARQAAKQIEKANEILGSIFRDLSPRAEEKGGPTLRVQLGRRLDRAAALLDEEAIGDPLTLAGLQHLLGVTQRELGYPQKAIELLTRAHRMREALLGPDHFDTLESMNSLAVAYDAAGQQDKALPLLEQALAKTLARLGPDDSLTLTIMANLAKSYQDGGEQDKALSLLEQTLAKRQAQLGPDHPDTLQSLNDLAGVCWKAGQRDKALSLLEQTLAKRQAQLGPDHLDTLESMNNLAVAYHEVGEWDKALPLFEQTLARRQAQLGPDHRHTLATMDNLAEAYQDAGERDKALPLLEQTLARRKAQLRPNHPDTLRSMNSLAVAYWQAGKLDRSVPLFVESFQLHKAELGPNHPNTIRTMTNLGVNYRDAGRLLDAVPLLVEALERARKATGPLPVDLTWVSTELAETYERAADFAKAEPLYRECLERTRKQFGADHPRTARQMARLGRNLVQQQKYAVAEPFLRECLLVRAKGQPDAWTTFDTQSLLGGSLLGQQKYAEAEPLLLAGYEGMKARAQSIPPQGQIRLTEALERLVQLYEAWGKKDQADKWRQQLQEATKQRPAEKGK
jgi:serine/threonine protein kinase